MNQYDISDSLDNLKEKPGKLEYILVDFPFARGYKDLNPYIDLSIYINTPLDIALTRRTLCDYSDKKEITDIFNGLNIYLDKAQNVFVDFQDYVMNSSDLVIDVKLEITENKIIDI